MLAHIAKMAGFTPGLTTTDGVYIDGQRSVEGDMTGPVATRMVLADPSIDLAVLEVARGGLVRAGMGVPFANVAAVLNVQSDHLGMKGVDTLEQLAEVKRIVVEVARDCAVLNADDEHTIRMSAHTDAKHLCYVTLNPNHVVVREHVRAGGRACGLEAGVNGQMITLYDKGRPHPAHVDAFDSRDTRGPRHAQRAKRDVRRRARLLARHQIGCHPAGAAHLRQHVFPGARAHERIRRASLQGDFDYAHNAHAVGAMADLAARLDVRGRRIVVVAGPGDRRDEDIRAIALKVAGRFDHYICRRDDSLRGRAEAEVPTMIAETLRERGVPRRGHRGDSRRTGGHRPGARLGRPGDLLLVFADALDPFLEADHQIQAGHRGGLEPGPQPPPFKVRPAGRAARRCRRARTPAGPGIRRCLARGAGIRARRAGASIRRGSSRLTMPQEPKAERELKEEPELEAGAGAELWLHRLEAPHRPEPLLRRTAVTLTPIGAAAGEPQALERWAEEVRRLSKALGWPDPAPVIDRAGDGTYLVFRAPQDAQLTATELSEWAWEAAAAEAGVTAFDRAHDFGCGSRGGARRARRGRAKRGLGRFARGRRCGMDCPCWRTTRRFPSVPARGACAGLAPRCPRPMRCPGMRCTISRQCW